MKDIRPNPGANAFVFDPYVESERGARRLPLDDELQERLDRFLESLTLQGGHVIAVVPTNVYRPSVGFPAKIEGRLVIFVNL